MTDTRQRAQSAATARSMDPWPKQVYAMEQDAGLAERTARSQRSAADEILRNLSVISDDGRELVACASHRLRQSLTIALGINIGRALIAALALYFAAVAGFGIWVGLWRGSLWWLGDLALLIAAARWGIWRTHEILRMLRAAAGIRRIGRAASSAHTPAQSRP